MKRIEIYENGINIVFEITDENEAKLLHFSALPFDEAKTASYMGLKTFRPVEIQASGIDRPDERHGNKYIVTAPGWRMKFKDFRDVNNDYGRKLELVTFDEGTGLEAVSHYQFYTGTSVVRCWTTLTNKGSEDNYSKEFTEREVWDSFIEGKRSNNKRVSEEDLAQRDAADTSNKQLVHFVKIDYFLSHLDEYI